MLRATDVSDAATSKAYLPSGDAVSHVSVGAAAVAVVIIEELPTSKPTLKSTYSSGDKTPSPSENVPAGIANEKEPIDGVRV